MGRAYFLAPFAAALLAPTLAHAQAAAPPQVAPAAPVALPSPSPGPRSRAVSIPIEILSPVGGAGCFYQRRILTGVLVTAGSLIAGGTMIWGIAHGDRDATIINAVAYGLIRGTGIFAAAQPTAASPASGSLDPARTGSPPPPQAGALPAPSGRTIGLWPRLSF
jgi:hypothetical protein